jgi:peptide/nickel transport system ATP-binding protein
MAELIRVENLKTTFYTSAGVVRAVDDVSFKIDCGQSVGLVGESGCGKSVTSLSILRLIAGPSGRIENGRILFHDIDVLKLTEDEMRGIRGNKISMIFQEPMTSLNPVFRIGDQIAETLMLHDGDTKKQAAVRAVEMLKTVGIPCPERVAREYPHQLSGGMRQRAMIAMAMACRPELLIADEPSTALDVTIQAQILDLMRELKEKSGTAILMITHDLGVVAEMCEYVIVMYGGKIVEEADVYTVFDNPLHPYTRGLMESRPALNRDSARLNPIPGVVPSPLDLPSGCYFHPRCSRAFDRCRVEAPQLVEAAPGHKVRCWLCNGGGGCDE